MGSLVKPNSTLEASLRQPSERLGSRLNDGSVTFGSVVFIGSWRSIYLDILGALIVFKTLFGLLWRLSLDSSCLFGVFWLCKHTLTAFSVGLYGRSCLETVLEKLF